MNHNYHRNSQREKCQLSEKARSSLEIARCINRIIKRKRKQTLDTLKRGRKVTRGQLNSFRILQQQFIDHCATIIQSRFKGFIQRKRYCQFLPIYRRFRQLILAVTQGWKTRKILKLNTIKSQINLVRDKQAKNQLSSLRISKRELIDEIERFKKKGKWVQQYRKQRMFKKKIHIQEGKQNSSLFANIKPVSIKNVFKKQFPTKIQIKNKNTREKQSQLSSKKVQPVQKKKVQQTTIQQITRQIQPTHKENSYDQIAITPKQNFYSLLEQKLYEEKQTKPQDKTKISKYLKKPVKKVSNQQGAKAKEQFQNTIRQKSKSTHNVKTQKKIQDKIEQPKLDKLQMNNDQNTLQFNRFKKIRLTLSKKSAQTQSLSSHRQVRSQTFELSPFSTMNSKYSSGTSQNHQQKVDSFDCLLQNMSFEYRNNYLKRTMSIYKKSDKKLGQYQDSQKQMQRYSLVELSDKFYS